MFDHLAPAPFRARDRRLPAHVTECRWRQAGDRPSLEYPPAPVSYGPLDVLGHPVEQPLDLKRQGHEVTQERLRERSLAPPGLRHGLADCAPAAAAGLVGL